MSTRKTTVRAIIFDMDGVIVDSMPYHFIAWYEALAPYGVRVSCFDVYTKEGERWDKTLRQLLRQKHIRPTASLLRAIFTRRTKIFKRYFKRFIFKGAPAFLACLKRQGYLLGLVTGTPQAEIERILPPRLRGLFDVIVAGDHVKQGKPHPEPYRNAGKKLGLRARECVVIENAPYGIRSAKAAGMFCIAVTTSLPRPYLRQADVVVDALEEITGAIESRCARRRR